MNLLILASGALCLFTFFVHFLLGQVNPVRPFLASNLEEVAKATLLACWHFVSVYLLCSSLILLYAGYSNQPDLIIAVRLISVSYILFAAVFITVGWYFFSFRAFKELPQWTLLLPIGLLGLFGAW